MYVSMFACTQSGVCIWVWVRNYALIHAYIHTCVCNSDVSIVSVQLYFHPTGVPQPGPFSYCCFDQYKYGESVMHYVKHAAQLSKPLREKNGGWLVNWRPPLHNWLAAVHGSSAECQYLSDRCKMIIFFAIMFTNTDWLSSLDEATIVARECFLLIYKRRN